MSQNQALRVISAGDAQIVDESIPELPADDYILVKTTAVAVNPTDYKHADFAHLVPCVGSRLGCDYAGIVVEVGSSVTKDFKKGDRICGPVNGGNGERVVDGSYAKYIIVKGDLQIHIPDNISDEEAATLGVAVTTVGQGLYQNLKLPLPGSPAKEPFDILIYGGSTAMGVSGIQYAKLSGARVITTASPHNFDYVKSLGADAVFDYNTPSCADDIRAYTDGKLTLAWDCQSTEQSSTLVAKAMSRDQPGYLGTLTPQVTQNLVARVNDKVKASNTSYYTVFGEKYSLMGTQQPVPEDYVFGKMFWELSRQLLAEGKLKPISVIKNRGGQGLKGVLVGFEEMRQGKVSAAKLVYTL
ncbi:hypothetical protein ACJZ2D_003093 [Fusarium nematophilum]